MRIDRLRRRCDDAAAACRARRREQMDREELLRRLAASLAIGILVGGGSGCSYCKFGRGLGQHRAKGDDCSLRGWDAAREHRRTGRRAGD
jgi:hypothetical protein